MKIIEDLKLQRSHSVKYMESNEVSETLSAHGIKLRKLIAPLLSSTIEKMSEYKLNFDNEMPKVNTELGKIFIFSHKQSEDVMLSPTIAGKKGGYFVWGNENTLFETTNGLFAFFQGAFYVNRTDKKSTRAGLEKMFYTVKNGGNVLLFPEGYLNINSKGTALTDELGNVVKYSNDNNSDVCLIQDLNLGVFRVSDYTGCEIIPCVIHYDETKEVEGNVITDFNAYVRYCEPLNVSKISDTLKDDSIIAENIINSTEYIYKKNDIKNISLEGFKEYLNNPLLEEEFIRLINIKDSVRRSMYTANYLLVEKYSNYKRDLLATDKEELHKIWNELQEKIVRACDVERINYRLDNENDRLIGGAPVKPRTIYDDNLIVSSDEFGNIIYDNSIHKNVGSGVYRSEDVMPYIKDISSFSKSAVNNTFIDKDNISKEGLAIMLSGNNKEIVRVRKK